MMDKYCYCVDGELFISSYDSRCDALEAAKKDLFWYLSSGYLPSGCVKDKEEYKILTGKCVPFQPKIDISCVECFIDSINDAAYEHCGCENFLGITDSKHIKELSLMFTDTFKKWLQKYNLGVVCWCADDVETHMVTRKDLGL